VREDSEVERDRHQGPGTGAEQPGPEESAEGDEAARVIRLPVLIRREDVLHFLGYPENRNPPQRVEARIKPALAEARELAAARGTYRHLRVDSAASVELEPIEAAALVVGLVTVGDRIEARVAEYLREGDTTSAVILDAAGSAAGEEAADHLGALIANDEPDTGTDGKTRVSPHIGPSAPGVPAAARSGPPFPVSCRISPGYGGWPLSAQRALFDLLPHERLGVSLLPSLLMVPRKSISFAMWLGADARPIAGLSGCVRCRLEVCRYRRQSS
jgi:hypothetical protein